MTNVLTLAAVELRLFVRDRSNLFFAFVFPLLLVFMIGLQFGEGAHSGRAALSGPDTPLHAALADRLAAADVVVSEPEWNDALDLLARGRIDVAVRVDDVASTAYGAGDDVTLEVVRGPGSGAQVVEQAVRVAVDAVRTSRSQVVALQGRGVSATRADAALAAASREVDAPELRVKRLDALSREFDGLGQFDYGASGQLLLFVFLSSLAGSSTLIRARRDGVVARMLAGPMTTGQVIAGEIAGRWGIGLFQGGYIMVATSLLFGVGWGHLVLSMLVLLLFSLVAAGAAILLGTLMGNEGAASGAGVGLGLVLAALGGSMLPLELFPAAIRPLADLTPHAWAYAAFADIQRRDGTLLDVLPQLGVLAVMAVVVATVGAAMLRRSLSRAT